jgi:hypothetical protein
MTLTYQCHSGQSQWGSDIVLSRRRVTFAILVLASQLLLMAVAMASCVQMILIARAGEVRFVETNRILLYTEILACVLIILFSVVVFALQLKRLSERRRSDDRSQPR